MRDSAPCREKRHWSDAFPGKSVTCNTKDTAQMQKQSQADKKQEEHHYDKKFKVTMEAQWAASECDFNNLFADKTSFAAYERQRMRWCFETVPSAEDRRARGQIKRRHSPTTIRPYIRILKSAGGEEEHLHHIPDRLKDLNSAAENIPREHGGAIFDVFVAFTGDMSAWWFEAGVLRSGGSSYKCACGCGVRSSEIAFYNQNVRALPSLQELQSSATAGKYGKIPGHSQIS